MTVYIRKLKQFVIMLVILYGTNKKKQHVKRWEISGINTFMENFKIR